MRKDITLYYTESQKQLWLSGKLSETWSKQCPGLYDDDDIRLLKQQSKYHFGEWLVAKYFYDKGYGVLIEKYSCLNHKRKIGIFKKYLTEDSFNYFIKHYSHTPDLFVYSRNSKDYFFVEVKVGRDKISARQKECFREIEEYFKCKVVIVNLKKEL